MINEYEMQDGLSCVTKNPENTQVHLVFVHGLGGGAFLTWNSGNKTELGFWPAVVAKENPSCCVWTLHYTANILDWNPFARSRTINLLDKSAWLVDQLVQNKIHEKPIVFVCHSLGGVLVKQALQFAQSFGPPDWRLVWEQTQSVVFLATPHVGSRLADIGIAVANVIRGSINPIARLFLKPSSALNNLAKNNPHLRYLRIWYRNHAPVQGIETIAYAEGKPLVGTPTIVVDMEDANPQIPNVPTVPLSDEDHISIAKPDTKRHAVYRRVNQSLKELEKRLNDGRVKTIASPIRLDKAEMMRLTENRQLISSFSGYWWQRIMIENVVGISFFQIRPHSLSNSVSLWGDSYDKYGETVAEWHSLVARVDRDQNQVVVSYLWKGKHSKGKLKGGDFHGFGILRFDVPGKLDGLISRGKGGFWDVNEGHPEETKYKSAQYHRVMENKLIQVMNDGSTKDIQSCVQEILNEW